MWCILKASSDTVDHQLLLAVQHYEGQITALVAGVLGTAPAPSQPLMEAGLDSLGAVELRNALGSAFGIELSPTVMLDCPTISALAVHIGSLVQPVWEQTSGSLESWSLTVSTMEDVCNAMASALHMLQ